MRLILFIVGDHDFLSLSFSQFIIIELVTCSLANTTFHVKCARTSRETNRKMKIDRPTDKRSPTMDASAAATRSFWWNRKRQLLETKTRNVYLIIVCFFSFSGKRKREEVAIALPCRLLFRHHQRYCPPSEQILIVNGIWMFMFDLIAWTISAYLMDSWRSRSMGKRLKNNHTNYWFGYIK